MNLPNLKLSNNVKIRKEYFGGIIFNMSTGDVIEVDRGAFTVISIIKDMEVVNVQALLDVTEKNNTNNINRQSMIVTLSKLVDLGVLDTAPNGVLSEDVSRILDKKSHLKLKHKCQGRWL